MAKTLFAISWFFVVCFAKADGKLPLCQQLADGKELADGKDPDSSSVARILFHTVRSYVVQLEFQLSCFAHN